MTGAGEMTQGRDANATTTDIVLCPKTLLGRDPVSVALDLERAVQSLEVQHDCVIRIDQSTDPCTISVSGAARQVADALSNLQGRIATQLHRWNAAPWIPAGSHTCMPIQRQLQCPSGHALVQFVTPDGGLCDGCGTVTPSGTQVMDCRACNWYLCQRCAPAEAASTGEMAGAARAGGMASAAMAGAATAWAGGLAGAGGMAGVAVAQTMPGFGGMTGMPPSPSFPPARAVAAPRMGDAAGVVGGTAGETGGAGGMAGAAMAGQETVRQETLRTMDWREVPVGPPPSSTVGAPPCPTVGPPPCSTAGTTPRSTVGAPPCSMDSGVDALVDDALVDVRAKKKGKRRGKRSGSKGQRHRQSMARRVMEAAKSAISETIQA